MHDCEELLPLIPAYAIGATDDNETRLIEAALADCPALVDELRAFQAVGEALAEEVPAMTPPPMMLGNVLAAAREVRPAASPAQTTTLPLTVHKTTAPPAKKPRRIPWALVAACVAFFLIITNAFWLYRASTPTVREITLRGVDDSGQVVATLRCRIIVSPNSESAVMVAENFPALDDASTYQVWLRRDGEINSLGVFRVDDAGSGLLIFTADVLAQPFDSIGVTVEPLGGSNEPTTPSVVRWQSS
ncbi:MAG: anti-sigma factor [Anaerolineae bacterium]|jgi:anti-sigma-K factor RskA|nr:anti-sigma factor [Anaerolineae bacterium]